jgi:hypothetical protein
MRREVEKDLLSGGDKKTEGTGSDIIKNMLKRKNMKKE